MSDASAGDVGADSSRTIARTAAGLGAVTLVSRLFGFLRVLVIAAVLGTTELGDTFQATNAVSNIVFELVAAGALSAVLVPTFVQRLEDGDQHGAEQLAGAVLWAATAVLGALALVGVLGAALLSKVLVSTSQVDLAQRRDLATFLLWFFVPQVVLYAWATVASALLYARRRFFITALAPIGNTVVTIAALVGFRLVAGDEPGLDLGTGARTWLVVAGTGGVIAFVGTILVGAHRTGFRLRMVRPSKVDGAGALLRHSGWGVALHSVGGMLLGAAVVLGGRVEGAVVAYQTAFVFFLAPYAVLAQPIHTAILPELASDAHRDEHGRFVRATSAALEQMATLTIVVGGVLAAVSLPMMRIVATGNASDGAQLLAAALAALAIGLYPYSAFLMLSRASYALGDSRTPALVALVAGIVGTATMIVGSANFDGAAQVAALGAGHSIAYLVGAIALARLLGSRLAAPVRLVPVGRLGAAALASLASWAVVVALPTVTRVDALIAGGVGAAVGLGGYAVVASRAGWLGSLRRMSTP